MSGSLELDDQAASAKSPPSSISMGSVRSAFDIARTQNRSLLVGYLPAGFPSIEASARAAEAMVAAGVLNPGEIAVLRWNPGTNLRAKANTASVQLDVRCYST